MAVIRRRGWSIPERLATPEDVFRSRPRAGGSHGDHDIGAGQGTPTALVDRRSFLAGGAATAVGLMPAAAAAQRVSDGADPTRHLYPARRNTTYAISQPVTDEAINTAYNNYYEFGSSKSIANAAQALKIRPWTVRIDGLVEKTLEIAIDDLIARMPLEERLYRHRCVEAWSMAIPWTGFPLVRLLDLARPLGSARYVRMESFLDADVASGQRQTWFPWPYVEGLTIAEASNDLAFLVTGAYGKPVSKQQGAPLRLAVPWKYGFKSAKGLVRFNFTDKRPKSFWEALASDEYGFWANVNPDVPHPRWSQATEEVIGTGERRPTVLFNGYGEYVAGLYKGLEQERLWS